MGWGWTDKKLLKKFKKPRHLARTVRTGLFSEAADDVVTEAGKDKLFRAMPSPYQRLSFTVPDVQNCGSAGRCRAGGTNSR